MKKNHDTVNAYDFDHTIYRGDASLDFIIFSLVRQPILIYHLPLYALNLLLYAVGIKTRKQIKQVAFSFLKHVKDTDDVLEKFWDKHESKIEDWYLQQKNSNDLIISASPEFLLKPIAKRLGIKYLIATIMDKSTGRIIGKNCRAEEKVNRINRYSTSFTILKCYSDSSSDKPLLNLSKEAYLVKKGLVTPITNL